MIHNIKVYSIDNCPYCVRAKRMLDMKGYKYEAIHLASMKEKEDITKVYDRARTFPIIVIDDKYIGGSEELDQWLTLRTFNGMDL